MDETNKTKIILIYGGQSAEHDISILSAGNICRLVMYDYYTVEPIYITEDGTWLKGLELEEPIVYNSQLKLKEAGVATWAPDDKQISTGVRILPGDIYSQNAIVFPALHGPNGEDGTIQGFLEVLNMPYVGAGVVASAAGMDKIISKQLFEQAGLPQVPYVAFDERDWQEDKETLIKKCEGSLLYPFFVKPANMGSSVGISRAENCKELEEAVNTALKYDTRIVVEQGIQAEECEVAVLGNEDLHVSTVGRLVKQQDFYDYDEKYVNNRVEMEIPAQIPEAIIQQIQDYAIKAFRVLNGSGLARVDFFVANNQDIYINEINTMPGFTDHSMYPVLWEKTGLSQRDLIEELLQLAVSRHANKMNLQDRQKLER